MLVCQFGSSRCFAPNSQTSNTQFGPSLQDCVRASLPQTCGRPTAHMAFAPGSRTYKGKRSRDCDRTSRPQTLAGQSPPAPQGEHNHPGDQVPAPPSVPRIRNHNIIPSVLWNSRQHPHCHAFTASIFEGQKPAEKALPGVRFHNTDYVNCATEEVCEGPPFELPGEAAAGKGLAAVAGPSPALCQPRTGQRNWGPAPPNSSTPAQLRNSVINTQPASPASTRKQFQDPAALCPSGGSLRL